MSKLIFTEENILLNAKFENKWDAIKECGNILVRNGYVAEEYLIDMVEREKTASVYIGNNVAIPHGISSSEDNILHSGISFIQVPDGVSFGDELAQILIGIAGKDGKHIEILGSIAMACMDEENLNILKTSRDKNQICSILADIDY